jgi:sec-independent protein translocase protein TatA
MFNLGFPELVVILIIALILFGPGKLPEVGASLGKAIKEFKKASREFTKEDDTSPLETKNSAAEKSVK